MKKMTNNDTNNCSCSVVSCSCPSYRIDNEIQEPINNLEKNTKSYKNLD